MPIFFAGLDLIFAYAMLVLHSVNSIITSFKMPILSCTSILIDATYVLLRPLSAHFMSMSLSSGTLSNDAQSTLCIETPLLLVTTPTIGSPGTGVQHFAK